MSSSLTVTSGSWFGAGPPRSDATAILFCLPYAGGGASAFRAWRPAAPSSLDVQPVQLPGREYRIREQARVVPADIAEAIVAYADRPYAIYGHSMGARVGFEVLRELRRRQAPMPLRFYVGGARPPDVVEPIARIWQGSDDEIVRRLTELGGTPAGVLDIPELRELVLPVLRADFQWIDSYLFQPEPPLPVPVVALAGLADPLVPPRVMLGWGRHTSGPFRLHTLPGEHFFLHEQAGRILQLIAADLLPDIAGTGRGTGARQVAGAGEPARVTAPATDEVHLWLASLDELPEACAATGELSAAELAQAQRLRRDTDRERYVGCRVLLRRLLRRYGVEATAQPSSGGGGGGPAYRPIHHHHSHCAGLLLVGVTAGQEIGVDIERVRPIADLAAFCDGALDRDEQDDIAALPEPDRLAAVLRIWTAKEAVRAAAGAAGEPGFAGQRPGQIQRPDVPPGRQPVPWRVTHLDFPGAVGAIAVAREHWRLRFEVVRPDIAEVRS